MAKGKRAEWARLPEAAKGFFTVAMVVAMVFGFKLHAPTNEHGLFEKWAFAPANQSDVTLAHELLEGLEDELVWGDPTLAPLPVRQSVRTWLERTTGNIGSPCPQTHCVELQ